MVIIMMYPNIVTMNALSLFFQVYSIVRVENKHYVFLKTQFVNFNLAPTVCFIAKAARNVKPCKSQFYSLNCYAVKIKHF